LGLVFSDRDATDAAQIRGARKRIDEAGIVIDFGVESSAGILKPYGDLVRRLRVSMNQVETAIVVQIEA